MTNKYEQKEYVIMDFLLFILVGTLRYNGIASFERIIWGPR